MKAAAVFPTFCHISEYGPYGYESLHRMLAVSDRLHLWSPSSVLLLDPGCQVPPKDFIKYVAAGRIVIHGRRDWLLDPAWRGHRAEDLPAAQWTEAIDGEIRSIYYDDVMRPDAEKRVVVSPPERGSGWAAEYVDKHPKEIDRWERILNGKKVASKLPAETLSSVRRLGRKSDGDVPTMVRAILQIAYNHGDAFRESGAEAPILLSVLDREFLKLLGGTPAETDTLRQDTGVADPVAIAQLTEQMFEVLQYLDLISGKRGTPGSLDKFLRGEGHTLLAGWFARLCHLVKYLDQRRVDGLVLSYLEHDVENAEFVTPLRQLRKSSRTDAVIGTADLIGDAVDAALSPVAGLAKLALGTYPVGKGVMRQLGWAPQKYTGPQWPFLYSFGGVATKKGREEIRYALREMRRRRGG